MKLGHLILVLFVLMFALAACDLSAAPVMTAQSVWVDRGNGLYGSVIVNVDGKELKVADTSSAAWLINGRRSVVYTGIDGAGGYENEGQSLYRYDLATGRRTKLFAEVYHITKVAEIKSRSGRPFLLVSMADGGLGAPHAAISRADGGLVWRSPFARFVWVANGRVVAHIFERAEAPDGNWSKARVVRKAILDPDRLARRR